MKKLPTILVYNLKRFLLVDRFRFSSLVQTFLRQLLDDARPDRVAPHVDHRTEAVSATNRKNNDAIT